MYVNLRTGAASDTPGNSHICFRQQYRVPLVRTTVQILGDSVKRRQLVYFVLKKEVWI